MGRLWQRMLRYLRQEPLPPGQAELEAAGLVLAACRDIWDADVLEIWEDGDTFTARLRREGSPDLLAEASMKQCGISVEPGDLLIVMPGKVVKRNLGVWTQAEVDEIEQRAHRSYEALSRVIDRETGLGWPS